MFTKETVLDSDHKSAAWITLRQMLATKKRGDRITASEVVESTGFTKWQSFGGRIRTWARGQGFALVSVPKDGWRIVLPTEHVDSADKRRRRALRQEVRGLAVLLATPLAELDERHLMRVQLATARSQTRVGLAREHQKEVSVALRGGERPPLRITGKQQ